MTQKSVRYLLACTIVLAALASSRQAHAQAGQVVVRSFDATTSPPKIFVRADPVDDGAELMSGLPAEQWKLTYYNKMSDADAVKAKAKDKDPITSVATAVKPFTDSDTTVAMVILIEGAKAFVGDKEYEQATDEVTPIAGTLNEAKDAAKTLAEATGKNGVAGVFFFGDNVMEKIPIGAPGAVKDIDVIKQEEFKTIRTHGFFASVDYSINALLKTGKQRKILVIISSGIEGLQDNQKADTYIDKARRGGVELYAIHYTTDELGNTGLRNMKALGQALGGFKSTKKPDQIVDFAKNIKDRIQAEYIVEFNAPEAPWSKDSDKKEMRGVKVLAGGVTSDKLEQPFGYFSKPSKGKLWPWLVFPGLGLILVIVIVMIAKRKPAPEPVYEAPPAPAPVAAAAHSPMKTVMLGIGGGGDDYPMVGWIVAVAGPQTGQTFKMQMGRTTIGTSQDQNIVVMDPFMSSRHAEIICTPVGFQLIDVGSSNGSYVNSKRIKSHDLVDNDAFTLGKTDFKFKSIN